MSEGRRLAAIMFTDMVGYTALMGRDEAHARQLVEHARSLLKSFVEKYHGQWLEEIGDGTLSAFPSAVEAVDCALAIQDALQDDPELSLRIGIHLGDVMFAEGRVYGDGVNVASRLEPLARPGGIVVSEAVGSAIRGHPQTRLSYLGRKHLKNVDQPVRVYVLTRGSGKISFSSRWMLWRRPALPIAALTLTVLAAPALYMLLESIWQPVREQPPSIEHQETAQTPGTARPRTLPRPLTTMEGYERHPALSPDGNYVAYTWHSRHPSASGPLDSDIYVVSVGGDTPIRLTDTAAPEGMPTWSPDGTQVAFIRQPVDAEHALIIAKPVLGGPERILHETASRSGSLVRGFASAALDWSPDGKWLAFRDMEIPDQSYSIFLLSLESGRKRQLTHPAALERDHNPVFSPNGHAIAFIRTRAGRNTVCTQLLDEASEACVYDFGKYMNWDIAWMPDGRAIAVVVGSFAGHRALLRVPLVGGDAVPLTSATDVMEFTVARDQKLLVYSAGFHDHDIWRSPGPLSNEPGSPEELIASTSTDINPRYSPDSKRIAFVSGRSGTEEIWVADADGSNPRQLTRLGFTRRPYWSKDGRRILFHACPSLARPEAPSSAAPCGSYLISAEGGFPKLLTPEEWEEGTPGWSWDERWIYFQTSTSDESSCPWQLGKKPVEGGETVRLPACGVAPREGPDGRVYYSDVANGHRVSSMLPDGGDSRLELARSELFRWGTWAFWKKHIVYVAPDKTVKLMNLGTREKRALAKIETGAPPWIWSSLAVSPDGRWIAYERLDRSGSDLKIIDPIPY